METYKESTELELFLGQGHETTGYWVICRLCRPQNFLTQHSYITMDTRTNAGEGKLNRMGTFTLS